MTPTFSNKCISLSLNGIKRISRFPAQVKTIGFLVDNWYNNLHYNHDSIIFGLFLNSHDGIVHRQIAGKEERMRCPVFCFRLPGANFKNLSPAPWDELYILYPADISDKLTGLGYVYQESREITFTPNLTKALRDLLPLMKEPLEPGNADRIDFAAYQVIMESQLAALTPASSDPVEKIVLEAASWIRLNYLERLDLNVFLRKKGITYWTFLRKWNKLFGKSPTQYALDLKMDEARRLLEETRLTVEAIANQLNINDPLYFSRLFRCREGVSPRQYRHQKDT